MTTESPDAAPAAQGKKWPERPAELDEGWLPYQEFVLRQPTPPKLLHTRNQGGKDLQYIAGHDAIAMANGVFGVGNWGYTTQQVWVVNAVYHAIVTLQVRTPGGQIVERGDLGTCDIQGWREGAQPNINAVQQAAKGCVTDGLKRCLRTFGDFFGLGLYDDDSAANHPAPANGAPAAQARRQPAAPASSGDPAWDALESQRGAPEPQERQCPACGDAMVLRSGVSKEGKSWSAFFCQAKCGQKPLWL